MNRNDPASLQQQVDQPLTGRPDLVIFDCDGVLIDSEVLVCRLHAEELTRHGFPFTTAEVVRRFVGGTRPTMYAAIEAEHGRPIPAGYNDRLNERIAETFPTDLKAIEGVAEAMDALGIPFCVASNAETAKLLLGLRMTGLHDRLAPHIFSASDVPRPKPAPDLFLHAARTMGADPARCLVVEDSPTGVKAGRAAGMTVLGFCGGAHCAPDHAERLIEAGAHRILGHMSELVGLVA